MSYLGESNIGSHHHHHHHHQDRTSSSSSGSGSSRKSKKNNNNSDKPKQPQRGLGVAQLEKIRLHSQIGCAFLPNPLHHHHNPFDANLAPHQAEDIGLQTGYSPSPSSFSYPPSTSYTFPCNQTIMMSGSELERGNVRYGDPHPISNPGSYQGIVYEPQRFAQSNMTRHFLNQHPVEDSIDKMAIKDRSYLTGSSGQNSDSKGDEEIDLELRLSL